MIMVLIGVITMFYILFVQGNVLSADPVVVWFSGLLLAGFGFVGTQVRRLRLDK